MSYLKHLIIPLAIFVLLSSCIDTYENDIQEWQQLRLKELKGPYSWPSVIGLYPLQDSVTTFGSAAYNDLIIAEGPEFLGSLVKADTVILYNNDSKGLVEIDGLQSERVGLRTDLHPDGPSYGTYNSIQWHIIKREGQYLLRVKDTLSQYRTALTSLPIYPIDKKYCIEGHVDPAISPDAEVSFKNILGMDITSNISAVINFQWEGQDYSLSALDGGSDMYWIMVHDQTTGIDTYGGGRYLYLKSADEDGRVVLDFNKLENPPCVFTPFATCPLPPKSNHLPFQIHAGEKMLHLY